jgi:site-specific DNA recombinase
VKQFVAWARVSSVGQKKEGFSLEDQEVRLREFAERLGGGVVKMYKVAETATRHDERTTFREFTAFVRAHARSLSGMLFVKVDRAARSIQSWAELEALAEATHVPMLFPDQPSADTPAGRMQRRMSAVFASYQTDQQASDIRAGLRRRVESGLPLGRPYGYRTVRVNSRSILEHDPIEAPKVKRLFELFAYKPLTVDGLREELARQGVAYRDHTPRFPRATLHKLLRNRHVIGEVRVGDQWRPGAFEPLVDRVTFNAVQAKLGGGKVYQRPELVFAGGLISCGHCGHCLTGETKRKRSPDGQLLEYTYYFCTQYRGAGHPRIRFTEARIEGLFLDLFARLKMDERAARWVVEVVKARAGHSRELNGQLRADLERQRLAAESRLKALLDLRVDREITAEDYAAKRSELLDRQAGLRVQLEETDRDDAQIADLAVRVIELSQSLENRWKTGDFRAKREILGLLCESVRSNSENLEIRLRKPFDLIASGDLVSSSGAEESRTPDLIIANDALYQLSYRPKWGGV